MNKQSQSRRPFIKSALSLTALPIAATMLPTKWSKPIVNSVVLPAHAQTSATSITFSSTPACGSSQPLADPITISAQLSPNPGAGINVSFTVMCNGIPSASGSFNVTSDAAGLINLAPANGMAEGCSVGDTLSIQAELDGATAICQWTMT
jgi:hypothetical protein